MKILDQKSLQDFQHVQLDTKILHQIKGGNSSSHYDVDCDGTIGQTT